MNSAEISRETGVSLRQLQWWAERNVVIPKIVNHAREYSDDQVKQIRIISTLRRAGLSFQYARKILPKLFHPPEGASVALIQGFKVRWIPKDGLLRAMLEMQSLSPKRIVVLELP